MEILHVIHSDSMESCTLQEYFRCNSSLLQRRCIIPASLSTMEYREVRTFAEEYFAGSSALNRKILGDIASVRTSCPGWDTLPVVRQDQVTRHQTLNILCFHPLLYYPFPKLSFSSL